MSEAERLNQVLASRAPAVARCLSPLGRAVAFPKGIPFQAAQAKATRLNGTIGQVTDGAGNPIPLPVIAETIPGLDRKLAFLYSPQEGHPEVRRLWLQRQLSLAGRTSAPVSQPFAAHGLVHAISLVADLFVDADTTIVLPEPTWENYELVFGMRTGARVVTYPFFDAHGAFDLDALGRALDGVQGKAVVLLNFPSNPTGWSPTPAEADRIVERVAAHPGPAVVLVDDAYQGVVHEPGLLDHSIFWKLLDKADPERTLPVKIDGATKELMLFPSRIGFLTAGVGDAEAEAALLSKLNCVVRGTAGSPPGPSQAMMLAALRDPERTQREFAAMLAQITARYRALKAALAEVSDPRIRPWPSNSAYFAMIGLAEGLDLEAVRTRLIAEKSVGLIAVPSANALRLAYCSTRPEDVEAIVRALAEVVATS
jgi:aspartate/methionine/tyrosine aminotransferase